jgi:cob(I)alamin adenosyltransferase
MASIYTKTGDRGETGLIGGLRVAKNSERIEALGEIDELNSWLGLLRTLKFSKKDCELLLQIQKNLYLISAEIADTANKLKNQKISDDDTQILETTIDEIAAQYPLPKRFLIPGGTPIQSHLHIARTVCRRAERRLVGLSETLKTNPEILKYINRLSDFIFMLILRHAKFTPTKTKR